jgi:uncharacterized membrane protein
MYFLDPQNGDRRQALLRDQYYSLRRRSRDGLEVAVRDLQNRARGVMAEGIAMVSSEGVPDYILEERLRSRLGTFARHPGAVQIRVENGRAILSGDTLAGEVEDLISGVSRLRGIRGVENQLNVHQDAGNIPHLQGEGRLASENGQWSPSTRLLAGVGATYLMFYSMFKGGILGFFARLGSVLLGSRALTNMRPSELAGKGEQGMIRVRKSIQIDAPVEEVYSLWSNFENFPRFMNNIESISGGGERSHWVVKGPAGSKVEFDAITTQMIPNELVAWETTPDSPVKHSGQVRFRENQRGTQVNVSMAYTPPAGAAGHAVAMLFGKDPKREMDSDLARMKSLLEEGKTTAQKRKVSREEVMPVTGGQGQERQQGRGTGGGGGQSRMEKDIPENIRREMGGGEENTTSRRPDEEMD